MSRNRLTIIVALALVLLSAGIYFLRYRTGGLEVEGPPGVSTWEVTFSARGTLPNGRDASIVTSAPPAFRRQHIFEERWESQELRHPEGRTESGRTATGREFHWRTRPGMAGGNYRVAYTFRCVLGMHRPSPAMHDRTRELDAPPRPQSDPALRAAPKIESNDKDIAELARELSAEKGAAVDQVRAFHEHVNQMPYQQSEGSTGALECLRFGGGDDLGKARLVVALCRSRGIPARVITGVVLNPNAPPALHHWLEAWIRAQDGPEGHWLPIDPTYAHFGDRQFPSNYLVIRLDDDPLTRGPGNPQVSFFAKPVSEVLPGGSPGREFWRYVSFANLPPAEQQLARFLLLLPPAVLIICIFRVVIGIPTYGMFSPALLGLIFRDVHALPWGLGIFVTTVLVGWIFRRLLDRFHLLLIPRAAVLLTLIVMLLLVVIVVAAHAGVAVTTYVALFPLIILTHMVERFWTVEAEDGTRASFKTLLGTVIVAATVALALGPDAINRWLYRRPETLGLVVAALLILGRYTGYRVSELYRFRDLIEFEQKANVEKEAEVANKATVTEEILSPQSPQR